VIGCLGAAQAPQDRLSGHAGKIRRARPDRPGPPLQPWSRVRCATPSPTSSASSTAISPRCALTSSPARKRARRTEPLVAVERLSRTHHSAGSWCRAAQRRAGWGAGATSGLEQRHGRTARPSRPSLQLLKPHSTNWTQTDSLSPPRPAGRHLGPRAGRTRRHRVRGGPRVGRRRQGLLRALAAVHLGSVSEAFIQFGTSSHAAPNPGRPLVCQVPARPHRLLPHHQPLTPWRAGRQGLLRCRVRQGRVRHLRAGVCPAPPASPCALPVEARTRKGSPRADGGTDFGRRCRVRSSR
jgi:hypothetical protein